jgi:bacterial/archaeal transporter family protein
MPDLASSWLVWALLSALFAALTAIFAKVGVEGVNSDLATFIRTIVVLAVLGAILAARGLFQPLTAIAGRTYLFLTLSGLCTGASWVCYFRALQIGDAARVAPVDKLSVVLVALLGVLLLGEQLGAKDWAGIGLITAGVVLIALK